MESIKLKYIFLVFIVTLVIKEASAQTLTETQIRNARATGYAIVAARNPGKSFSIIIIPWDGVNTLEYNANTQINSGWHAQAVIKGNYFYQSFDNTDFSVYSSVLVSQSEFDQFKNTGTQWWIVCSTLPPFSNSGPIVSDNGNIGIGTSTPRNNLELIGSTGIRISDPINGYSSNMIFGVPTYWNSGIRVYDNGNAELRIWHKNPLGNIYLVNGYDGDQSMTLPTDGLQIGSYNKVGIGINGNLNVGAKFQLNGGASFGNNYTSIDPGNGNIIVEGHIGIGTTNPNEKLTVNGNIRAKKLIISQTGWPDYVFDSKYKLKPLFEVEQFIKKYRHLPDVPSEANVAKNGISVGDNQTILLKKIEELTLYVIELEKKVSKLEKSNTHKRIK